jgi:DNA-directed RNA polymerase specialized sigma24 family protein
MSSARVSLGFEDLGAAEHDNLFSAPDLTTGRSLRAEDAMQEESLRIWARGDQVHRMNHPSGHLYRTARRSDPPRRRLGKANEP